jgi:hypothetical protein
MEQLEIFPADEVLIAPKFMLPLYSAEEEIKKVEGVVVPAYKFFIRKFILLILSKVPLRCRKPYQMSLLRTVCYF